jgi:hypothetical protein
MRAGPEGIGTAVTTEGQQVATAYTTLSRYGWAVIVGRPTDKLRAAAFERMGVYGIGIALSLLGCFLLASLLANRIVRTIEALQQGAAALARARR